MLKLDDNDVAVPGSDRLSSALAKGVRTAILIASFVIVSGATANTEPPAEVTRYVASGHFDPGNYEWMRGKFSDASAADKSVWESILAWQRDCKAADQEEVARQLRSAGVKDPQIPTGPYANALCAEVSLATPDVFVESFEKFKASLAQAQRIADAIIWTTRLAQNVEADSTPTLQHQIRMRVLTDQILRGAVMLNDTVAKGRPTLDPGEAAIVRGQIWLAISRTDRANTKWLEPIIDKEGWLKPSVYGEETAKGAWLLIQHAGNNPLFQFKMLRLLKVEHERHEISSDQYTLLWDRVMYNIKGKQTYGTQLSCHDGEWQPLSLEDPSRLDVRRESMGLRPIKSYIDGVTKAVGHCS